MISQAVSGEDRAGGTRLKTQYHPLLAFVSPPCSPWSVPVPPIRASWIDLERHQNTSSAGSRTEAMDHQCVCSPILGRTSLAAVICPTPLRIFFWMAFLIVNIRISIADLPRWHTTDGVFPGCMAAYRDLEEYSDKWAPGQKIKEKSQLKIEQTDLCLHRPILLTIQDRSLSVAIGTAITVSKQWNFLT